MDAPRVDVDFMADAAVIEDPFPHYEEIRAAGRVVWNGAMQGWMVPGFDDCSAVLSDNRQATYGQIGARYPEATFWFEAPNMIIADGAEHRRLRHGLAKYFTPAYAAGWEPRIRDVVGQLLAPLAGEQASFSLEDFTKIPVIIVAEMLGVPEEHHEDFRRWSNEVTGNNAYGREQAEIRAIMDRALAELNAYLDEEIERHRREQPDDVFTVMVNMPDWTEAEIRSSTVNLLLAGYDTTAKLMTQCLVALEQHPDQRRLLAETPELVPNAIEEILRWDGVAQADPRVVKQETELAGQPLKDGDVVWNLLAAANRDPSRWDDPQRLDVRREYKPNLGFGVGPHVCIGAPLARLEVKAAIETLLRIAPEYHLRDLDYGQAFLIRGPERGTIELAAVRA
jgi:cytochrome P450